MFPTIAEYNQVIKGHGVDAFRTLHGLSFIPSRTLPIKIFSYGSGSYAVVFKAEGQYKEYAIRCFISAEEETLNRYRSISKYLQNLDSSWYTGFEILEDEIDVHGRYYPIVKMEWVNGQLLNKYISEILQDNNALTSLQEEVIKVSKSLEENLVGHGDIQCGNVLIVKDCSGKSIIKLIDYDGLYIPEFKGKKNLEHGRSEFQHPNRNQSFYNEQIDRFSFWVILCALEALKHDKSLWLEVMQGGFNTLDNLLFTGEDFKNFKSSKLVQRLYSLNKPALAYYLNSLEYFCNSPISSVEKPSLYNVKGDKTSNPEPVTIKPNSVQTNSTAKKDLVEIISRPAGASVLTTTLQKIGQTPLAIDKTKYLNKTLIVSYGSQVKQTTITNNTRLVDISFPEEVSLPGAPKPKLKTTVENSSTNIDTHSQPKVTTRASEKKDNTVILDPAVRTTVGKHYTPSQTQANTKVSVKKDYTVILTVALLVVIVIGMLIAANNNSSNDEEYAEETEIVVKDAPISGETDVQTTAVLEEKGSEERLVSTKDDYNQTANEVIWLFFDALNNQNCEAAWNETFITYWEEKGKGAFCDINAYGGVKSASILTYQTAIKTEDEMLFRLQYSIYHTVKGSVSYDQYIRLLKRKNGDHKMQWYITEFEDAVTPLVQ